MPTVADTFTGFRPEAIQFLADLAANNERTWFQPRKADYERLLKEPLEALCVALAERVRGPRDPAPRRPGAVAVPDLPRRALLEGQVAVQDQRRRELSVGRRRRGLRRRLFPPGTGRGLRRRRDVAPGAGQAQGLPPAGRHGSRARPRGDRRPGIRRRLRARLGRDADARAAGLLAPTTRTPSCSSSRTLCSCGSCPTTTWPRPSCPIGSPTTPRLPLLRLLARCRPDAASRCRLS